MSAFPKAAVYALQDSPVVNAVIDNNHNEVVYRDYIDIERTGSTCSTHCNHMNYVDIERGIAQPLRRQSGEKWQQQIIKLL